MRCCDGEGVEAGRSPVDENTQAIIQAEAALKIGSRDPRDSNLVAWARLQNEHPLGALDVLEAFLAHTPNEPHTLCNCATVLRILGRLREAILRCDAALQLDPHFVPAWRERGFILRASGESADAVACFVRVLETDPQDVDSNAALANLALREGDIERARDHCDRAARLTPDHPEVIMATARLALETGDVQQALQTLKTQLVKLDLPSENRIALATLAGEALARNAQPDEAIISYIQANDDFRALHAQGAKGSATHRSVVEQTFSQVSATSPQQWRVPPAGRQVSLSVPHVFLLGYPRSGNTLVENILASLPRTHALEERPTLAFAEQRWLASADGIAQLLSADGDTLDEARAVYWDKAQSCGWKPGQALIDMDPLKTLSLPLISRLFPAARIIFVRRDPRDVVWSVFRTSFVRTSASLEFTSLESAALHFSAMMDLAHACFERCALNFLVLKYDQLVRAFEAETRLMCAFIGLPWDVAVHKFSQTARRRGVTTASATQVRKGLYDGTGQWEQFSSYMAPVLPILAPWIERFGYPAQTT